MSSGSKKGTQIYHPFHSKSPGKQIPSRFPIGAPMERDTHFQGIFCVSLNISLFIYPSESVVREPPLCSLTGSPWTGILHHQSHWSIIHSFIHVCLPESPKRSLPTYGEKHKVTVHGAPRRRKAYILWGGAWFPKGIINKQHRNVANSIKIFLDLRHHVDWYLFPVSFTPPITASLLVLNIIQIC